MKTFNFKTVASLLCIICLSAACKKESMESVANPEQVSQEELASRSAAGAFAPATIYALTGTNKLVGYSLQSGLVQTSSDSITGIQSGEKILAIDFRPATGQLYGIGSSSRIYIINLKSGVARAVNATSFTPAINGTVVGFDFNPTVDRIRMVTSDGQNLRLHPETGLVAFVDASLNPGSPAVNAVAYSNNTADATVTALYDIDPNTDMLYMQSPPNNGTLTAVGPLGRNILRRGGGFDISPDGMAYAALYDNSGPSLYTIDLVTGTATPIGAFTRPIIGLAVPTKSVAYAIAESNNDLLILDPFTSTPVSRKTVTGLQSGETILGIDFRPLNGQLFALGSSSRIYTLNTSSGLATVVGSGPFSPTLSGTSFGFDFNPTVDKIRIVSNTGQNMRADPLTGGIIGVDAALNPGTPSVSAAAYINNFAGATTTILYDIDFANDKLYKQDPPAGGTLVEVGSLGMDATASNGFDISGMNNAGYAFLSNTSGANGLYSVNLNNGKVKPVRTFAENVRGFALGLGF